MTNEVDGFTKTKRLVESISVRRLFGHYDYDLKSPTSTDSGDSRFMILYGDNGSGKTTILKLLYAILSPDEKKGYRTYLAKTRFGQFSVRFSDGFSISAVRPAGEIQGSYTLAVQKDSEELASVLLRTDETLSISPRTLPRKRLTELALVLDHLAKFTLPLIFLPENRKVVSNPFASSEETNWGDTLPIYWPSSWK